MNGSAPDGSGVLPARLRRRESLRAPKRIHPQENLIMQLAAFIRSNEEVIVAEWEAFAHTNVPSAAHMEIGRAHV